MVNLYNRKIVVNNDFDGISCAYLLIKLYNCVVVAFSNSKDIVWMIDHNKFCGDELFVDMFTPYFDCIDQHILPHRIKYGYNPNEERKRYAFTDYRKNYPFSTYFWLLTIAARDGFDISGFVPKWIYSKISQEYTKYDVFLRADDSLLNCFKYKQNCLDWKEYLINYSNNDKNIISLFNFMFSQKEDDVKSWKHDMEAFFRHKYGINGEELVLTDTEKSKKFLSRFGIKFNKITSKICFNHYRITISSMEEFNNLSDSLKENLFSYAFVFSPNNLNKKNFSYSVFKTYGTTNQKENPRNTS